MERSEPSKGRPPTKRMGIISITDAVLVVSVSNHCIPLVQCVLSGGAGDTE